jgi:AcrR family transcriptional regulator
VSEICRKADLDRRTFYRNFNSKNDVLDHFINLLGKEYIEIYATVDASSKYTATKVFFDFWSKYLNFIRNIKNCGLSDFIFQRFENFTKEHTELLIGHDGLQLPLEYVYAYRIGAFWNVMLTWATSDVIMSPDEIASIVSQI